MSFSIEVDHDLRLIRYCDSGQIGLDDIGGAWQEFLKLPEFTQKKYNLLSDYSKGTFNFSEEQIDAIVEFMRQIEPIVRGKKQALIVSDPLSTAASMLFEEEVYKEVGFDVKVFSTIKVAVSWLTHK